MYASHSLISPTSSFSSSATRLAFPPSLALKWMWLMGGVVPRLLKVVVKEDTGDDAVVEDSVEAGVVVEDTLRCFRADKCLPGAVRKKSVASERARMMRRRRRQGRRQGLEDPPPPEEDVNKSSSSSSNSCSRTRR